jgi:DNA repair exonuclease SbcCD ATPase subunit
MTLLVAVSSLSALLADNRITVEDVTIMENGTAVVSVKMVNDPKVNGMGAYIKLPVGLEIVKEYDANLGNQTFVLNPARTYDPTKLYEGQVRQRHFVESKLQKDGQTYIMGIANDDGYPFIGNSGEEVFHFTVKANDALPDSSQIEFTNVNFQIDGGIGQMDYEVKQDNFNVPVKKVDALPPSGILSASPYIRITPADAYQIVTVSLKNNFDVEMFQCDIDLPEGLHFVDGVEGFLAGISLNERAKTLKPKLNKNTGVVTLTQESSESQGKILAGEGEIFAFIVKADKNLAVKDTINIKVGRISVFNKDHYTTVMTNDVRVIVENQNSQAWIDVQPMLDEAKKQLQAAQQSIAEYLRPEDVMAARDMEKEAAMTVAKNDVKTAWVAAKDAYEALVKLVNDAYEEGTLINTDYQNAYQASLNADKALISAGKQAELLVGLSEYLDGQWDAYDAAVAAIPDDVKDYHKVTTAVQAAEQALATLKTRISDRYEEKKLTETSMSVQKKDVEDAIEKIKTTAAQAKQDMLLEALNAKIDNLQSSLNGAKAVINTYDIASEFAEQITDIQDAIDAERERIAGKAGSLTDEDAVDADEAIKNAIDKLQKDAKAENDRYEANEAAKKRLDDELKNLKESVENTLKEIEENNPDVFDEFGADVEAINKLVEDIENGVKTKYDNRELTNEDVIDPTEVNNALGTLKTDAEQAQARENELLQNAQNVIDDLEARAGLDTEGVEDKVAEEQKAADDAVAELKKFVDDNKGDLTKDGVAEQIENLEEAAEVAVKALEDKVATEKKTQEEEAAAATSLANKINNLKRRIADAVEKAAEFGVLAQADNAKTAANEAVADLQKLYDENTGNLRNMAAEISEGSENADNAVKAFEEKVDELIKGQQSGDAARAEYQNQLDSLKERQKALAEALDALVDDNDNLLTDSSKQYTEVKEQLDNCKDEDIALLQNALTYGEDFTSDEAKELIEGALDDIADSLDAIKDDIDALSKTKKRGNVTEDENGDINISDYLAWIRQINKLETEEGLELRDIDVNSSEEYRKLDLNGDGKLTSADLRYLVNLVLSTDIDLNARIMSPGQESLTTTVQRSGNTQRIALNLSSSISYAAMQADVVLPEGMTFKQAELTERTGEYTLMVTHIGNKTRIRVITFNDITFKGTEGALLYIDLEGQGEARVQDVLLADVNAVDHELAVNAAETTGIDAARAEAGAGQVYSLSGRVMNALRKGINIIRRADGSTQKVIK